MHAITPLLAGIRGAENGYAKIFARGTATRATWYSTFEGNDSDSSGDDIALDANGGAEVYVNELVDVVVVDTDGAEVRSFTDGLASGNVEVRSQSFTGADYDDVSTGQGGNYPTTLQAVLDLWKDKTGAYDWDILLGSTTYTLVQLLGGLSGFFYNVKNPSYGAAGDGTTDDTAAIAAAITAAASAGGIVYFPPGTYRVTSALSVPAKVSLLGCGSASSALLTDHATATTIEFTGAATYAPQSMVGLRIGASQANTGSRVGVDAGVGLVIERCFIGGTNSNSRALEVAGGSSSFLSCKETILTTAHGSTSVVGVSTTGSRRLQFDRCIFICTNTSYSPALGMCELTECSLHECTFDASAATAGTLSYFYRQNTSVDARITSCTFLNGGGATVTAIELGIFSGTAKFLESENTFGSTVTAYSYTSIDGAVDQSGAQVYLKSRENRVKTITDGTGTAATSTDLQQYGHIIVEATFAGATLVSLANYRPPPNNKTKLTIWNNSGAGRAMSVTDPLSGTIASWTSISDDNAASVDLVFHVRDTTHYGWSCVFGDVDGGYTY